MSRPKLTHFLCLPLVTAASRAPLSAALSALGRDMEDLVPPSAIRPVDTLHLTLGVMSLSAADVQAASTLLSTIPLPSEPIDVRLSSLLPMTPTKISVLYAVPSDAELRLLPFAQSLRNTFEAAGFIIPDDRGLKLHATVVNTVYIPGPRKRGRLNFDAAAVLAQWADREWATVRLDRISICRMGAQTTTLSDGITTSAYTEVAVRKL